MSETLGEALRRVHAGVVDAEATLEERRAVRARLVRDARREGVSVRTLAIVLDTSPQTVFNWSGGKLGDIDGHLRGARRLNGPVPE